MLERVGEERDLLDALLRLLFPATQGFLGRISYGSEWDGTWRKQRRVACGEVFRAYLASALDVGGVSTSQVREVFDVLAGC